MTTAVPEELIATLKTDLHAETLGTERGVHCDFCERTVETDRPVLYEALHITDLDGLTNTLPVPDMWLLDGARCVNCEIETIEPATDGIEEALCRLSIVEANGIYSVDTSTLEVVAYSPSEEGYYPPVVLPKALLQHEDLGLMRWHRIRELLEITDEIVTRAPIEQILSFSKEVPPSVAAFQRTSS